MFPEFLTLQSDADSQKKHAWSNRIGAELPRCLRGAYSGPTFFIGQICNVSLNVQRRDMRDMIEFIASIEAE